MPAVFDPAAADARTAYQAQLASTVATVAVRCTAKAQMGYLMKCLFGYVFARRGVRPVSDDGDARVVCLCPDALRTAGATDVATITCVNDLPAAVLQRLQNGPSGAAAAGAPKRKPRKDDGNSSLDLAALSIVPRTIQLTWANYTMEEILAKLLPTGVIVPSGFEQIGHIAHLNLHDAQLPYKHLIGQVLLDTSAVSGVRTVVNKLDSISSQFRELALEVIAGEAELTAMVRQHGINFTVPFDKVYWNSRLSREHDRLVGTMAPTDVLFDVMAGVGPFAIPAAQKGLTVHANDLNPASVAAMRINARDNLTAAQLARFTAYEEDGRAFIRRVRAEHLVAGPLPDGRVRHFSMNLPALAMSFLDAFTGPEWHDGPNTTHDRSFLVHVYGFSKASDPTAAAGDAVAQCDVALGGRLCKARDVVNVHIVRDVAPNKVMVCVSLRLPPSCFGNDDAGHAAAGGSEKRHRAE